MSTAYENLPDPEEVAKSLNACSPMERERFIAALRGETIFCWECFRDDGGRTCHCTNDE